MNKRELDGDCSDVSIVNSVAKCDESRVAFTNEDDVRNEMVRLSEDIKSEKNDSESDSDFHGFDINNDNHSATSEIEIMKEEYCFGNEIESKFSEYLTLKYFENDSGEHANVDVAMPVVSSADVSINSCLESVKAELPIKQEQTSQGLDESDDGLNYVFEIAGTRTTVNMEDSEPQNFTNETTKVGRKLLSRGCNKYLTPKHFENDSGAHANVDVAMPVVSSADVSVNSRLESVKAELPIKQEQTSQGLDESDDGLNYVFEIAGTRTTVNMEDSEPQNFTNETTKVGRKLLSRGCNNKMPAATINAQLNRRHVREYRNRRSSKGLQSSAQNVLYPSVEAHVCVLCKKSFKSRRCLTRHARMHKDSNANKCTVCNKTFRQTSDLTKHERIHSGTRPYKCTFCNKAFTQSSNLNRHKRIHSGARPYKCTVCNKAFAVSSNLNRHERIHSGARPYKCTVCNKAFAVSSNLNIHKRIHSGARPYKCTVCNKAFAVSSNLTKHKRVHSGARPYKCQVCNKAFTQSANLNRHKRIHSGARPYKCTVCNKVFAVSSNLTNHKRVHSGARLYKCTVCNKAFTQSSNLNKHKRIHSGARPYKCTVCNKTFTQSANLNRHKRIHSGARPYKCTVCNKTFAQSSSLTKHERIHSGARPYKCPVCNKPFKFLSAFTKHERLHSDNKSSSLNTCAL